MEISELCKLIEAKQKLFSKVRGTVNEVVYELQHSNDLGPAIPKLDSQENNFYVSVGQTQLFVVTEQQIMERIRKQQINISIVKDTWIKNTVIDIIKNQVS